MLHELQCCYGWWSTLSRWLMDSTAHDPVSRVIGASPWNIHRFLSSLGCTGSIRQLGWPGPGAHGRMLQGSKPTGRTWLRLPTTGPRRAGCGWRFRLGAACPKVARHATSASMGCNEILALSDASAGQICVPCDACHVMLVAYVQA